MNLGAILAADLGWAIGNKANPNGLPWENIPEDFKSFQKITKEYKRVVMGHETWKQIFKILGKPLPGRECIVLSKTLTEPPHPDVKLFHSVEKVLAYLGDDPACIIGGAQIYAAFLPYINDIYLSVVHTTHDADCFVSSDLISEFHENTDNSVVLVDGSDGRTRVVFHHYVRE